MTARRPQQPPDPGRVQGWAYQRRGHAEPRVQRRARPTLMAYPRREHPDRPIVDAAWIAWSIAILLWIGAMTGGLKP